MLPLVSIFGAKRPAPIRSIPIGLKITTNLKTNSCLHPATTLNALTVIVQNVEIGKCQHHQSNSNRAYCHLGLTKNQYWFSLVQAVVPNCKLAVKRFFWKWVCVHLSPETQFMFLKKVTLQQFRRSVTMRNKTIILLGLSGYSLRVVVTSCCGNSLPNTIKHPFRCQHYFAPHIATYVNVSKVLKHEFVLRKETTQIQQCMLDSAHYRCYFDFPNISTNATCSQNHILHHSKATSKRHLRNKPLKNICYKNYLTTKTAYGHRRKMDPSCCTHLRSKLRLSMGLRLYQVPSGLDGLAM